MRTAYTIVLLLTFAASAFAQNAATTDDLRRVDSWKTVTPPPKTNRVENAIFSHAANYSSLEWQVYLKDGVVRGEKKGSQLPPRLENSPAFEAKADQFSGPHATHPVEDGWLVGYNYGEFGASLYWFNADGTKHYKISDHQIVDFVVIGGRVYAIEGLAHLGMSEGSLIRISSDAKTGLWTASTSLKFPFAPYALALGKDDILFVVLSDALVVVKDAKKLVTLMPEGEWEGLYPNSAVLSRNGSSLYIGMRHYDLDSLSFELLIPDENMLNRLSREDEERIRNNFGG